MDKEARAVLANELRNKKYESGVSIITPSGERHEAIKRTHYYIERQTFNGPIQWIICDDSDKHYEINTPSNVVHFTHKKRQYPGNKSDSFRSNVVCALKEVLFDRVLIFEDDDWYHPDYIVIYKNRLLNWQLTGEGPARYYNVQRRTYRVLGNTKRASFCQTGLQASILDKLLVACYKDSAFVDARLWDKNCRKFVFQDGPPHCIGVKGMPGRAGIGMGHRSKSFTTDHEFKTLERWIGKEDTNYYREIHAKFFQKL